MVAVRSANVRDSRKCIESKNLRNGREFPARTLFRGAKGDYGDGDVCVASSKV